MPGNRKTSLTAMRLSFNRLRIRLQDIYFFLNTLKANSKNNILTILKELIRSYFFGKGTDEVEEKVKQAVVWMSRCAFLKLTGLRI